MEANELDPKIMEAVECDANRLTKQLSLSQNDRDDVQQELYLAALAARELYRPDMKATMATYIMSAIHLAAFFIFRKICSTESVGRLDDLKIPFLDETDYEGEADLSADIAEVIVELPERQRRICQMLMQGETQDRIAWALGMAQQRVSEEIVKLRPVFEKLLT